MHVACRARLAGEHCRRGTEPLARPRSRHTPDTSRRPTPTTLADPRASIRRISTCMSQPPSNPAEPDGAAASPPPGGARPALPRLRTSLSDAEILDRLGRASRRGKLAGFHAGAPAGAAGPGALGFWLDTFGQYFDRRLTVRAVDASNPPSGQAGPARLLCFENRVKPFRVWAFWVICILSIWPGVLLVHSMMATYFGWYPRAFWITCAWYLPLSAGPVPLMWRSAWRKSAAVADAEARLSIGRIAQHLGAATEDPGQPPALDGQDRANP